MFFVKHVNFNLAKFMRKGEQCFKHTNFEFFNFARKMEAMYFIQANFAHMNFEFC